MQTIDQASDLRQRIAEQMARQTDEAVFAADDAAHEWNRDRIAARLRNLPWPVGADGMAADLADLSPKARGGGM